MIFKKKAPLFSIVIPTRNRAHLLPFAIKSALAQNFKDYEIVVVANNCIDNTRKVVSEFKDSRIRYFETDQTLTMPENWEYAWTKAKGKYVTYLSDDDAISPSALKLLAKSALHDQPEVVSWEDAVYYYPNWNDPRMQNILLLFHFGNDLVEDLTVDHYQSQLSSFSFAWSSPLPKLLNCIVNREFFETWRQKLGTLFFPIAPDYSFAWISTHVCSKIRVLHRPLSIRGISDYSIGSNAGLGAAGNEFYKEFGTFNFFAETELHLPLSLNHLAATFLRVTKALESCGVKSAVLDQKLLMLNLAKQLNECRKYLSDWTDHQVTLLEYIKRVVPDCFDEVSQLLSATPEPVVHDETLRELHQRTAHMSRQNVSHIKELSRQHMGDEHCAACLLAHKDEILVDQNWSYLYVFGDAICEYDPFGMSMHVDKYYNLMLDCKKKRDAYGLRQN